MKLQLTKYPKLNFVILKIIEITSVCLIPFWMGKLSGWLHALTGCWLFNSTSDRLFYVWLSGIDLLCFLVMGCLILLLIATGGYCLVKQNIKWAKKLTREDKKNETR